MKLYEIIGREDSELSGMVFGHFTNAELAEKGYQALPEEIQEETDITSSNLQVNTVEVDDKVIHLDADKSAEEIIASRNEDNYVTGYVRVHISDLIDNDLEGFLDIISESLVGSGLLMDINYDIVGLEDGNVLVLKVTGDVSNIVEEN